MLLRRYVHHGRHLSFNYGDLWAAATQHILVLIHKVVPLLPIKLGPIHRDDFCHLLCGECRETLDQLDFPDLTEFHVQLLILLGQHFGYISIMVKSVRGVLGFWGDRKSVV